MNISTSKFYRRFSSHLSWLGGKIAFVALALIIFTLFQFVFRISKIDCRYGENSSPENITVILDSYKHQSVFLLNKKHLEDALISTGLSESAKVKVQLPSSMIITISPQTKIHKFKGIFSNVLPSFNFLNSTGSAVISPEIDMNLYLASQSGKTFSVTPNGTALSNDSDTTNILVSKSFPGRESLTQVYRWLDALESGLLKVNQIYFIDDMIIIRADGLPNAVFLTTKDPQTSIKSLQSMKSLIKIGSTKVIDFRFNHPILR